MIRVLFVCLGNICRSPMAEAVFLHKVRAAGLEEKIEADSAGTGNWHLGQPPHPGTRRILDSNNIAYEGCARQLTAGDFDRFDYIITMDESNFADVQSLQRNRGNAKAHRLMEFAPHLGAREVPDPYYDGRYPLVYELVNAATEGLLAAIRREHNL